MKRQYVGAWTVPCLIFIIFAVVVTIFYQHRVDTGRYKFGHTYYIHDKGIAEYSSSSLVSFPIKGNYDDLIDKEVYYYDSSDALKKDKLVSISLSTKKFSVDGGEYDTSKFLGVPSSGIPLAGSVLDFFGDKLVYICGALIPGILCILYELYAIFMSFRKDKNNY